MNIDPVVIPLILEEEEVGEIDAFEADLEIQKLSFDSENIEGELEIGKWLPEFTTWIKNRTGLELAASSVFKIASECRKQCNKLKKNLESENELK